MNKIFYTVGILFFFSAFLLNAQSNYYYYYKGEKIYLTLDKNYLNITTFENFDKSTISNFNFKDFNLEIDSSLNQTLKFAKLEFQSTPTDIEYFQKINSLKLTQNIRNVSIFFKKNDLTAIGTSSVFYVKLKSINDSTTLQQIANQKNVQIIRQLPYMPLWYELSLNPTTIGNSIELSNYFYETGFFADIDPSFMFDFRNNCANDPSFYSQWGLNGSNPNIKACEAWTISQGNGIKVAVVDQGIYMTHNDLAGNISSLSLNTETNYIAPSLFTHGKNHGTHVAGIIGAIKNNSIGVVGIAPQCELMGVSNKLAYGTTYPADLAKGISWAWQNGADVINNSWGDQGGNSWSLHSAILENAINDAITLGRNGKGCIVVFAAGNYGNSGPYIDYPASFNDDIICVGSINSTGNRSFDSGYGNKLDIVAPGVNIFSTMPYNNFDYMDGTSMATPHVSGVAALMLSVNPNLTGKQVRDIIESTAQKIGNYSYTNYQNRPNGIWNNQMGYGLLDAYAAVQIAQPNYIPALDLYIKDSPSDYGIEPNTVTQYMWDSEDIWVRHNPDGITDHQNPLYNPSTPNYVYVRVINKSLATSTGNEQLKLYWTKASTSIDWPNHWDGSFFQNGISMGQPIGTLNIPVLNPGQETVLQFAWNVPNQYDYMSITTEPWHFCLLARIEASNDPMTYPETIDLNSNVRKNNNIAWKNITMANCFALGCGDISGVVAVGTSFDELRTYNLVFSNEDSETGKAIFEEAEIGIKMDEVLYHAWEIGGRKSQLIENTADKRKVIVKGNNATLENISFNPNEIGFLNLTFNFLTKEITDKSKYVYHVIQKNSLTGEVIGGETYVIKKQPRIIFIANAGEDKEINKNDIITISAEQISEAAIYNWYDINGNLIYQGKDLTVSTDVTSKYKLEVIAIADGYKDYDEVEVKFKPSSIEAISPNPSSDKIIVSYKLNDVNSAYLMIIGYYGNNGTSNNYILDANSTEINISLSNYLNGFYTVALVCNGKIVDAKTLIKQ
ncbi:MAG: S8 family peptidase [Bacteroidales bacterium]